MALLEDMVEETLSYLENPNNDIVGSLDANISAVDTSFTIDGSSYAGISGFRSGIVEIGLELVYIQNINPTTGVVSGVIRGYRGTTATDHGAGTLTRMNPKFTRFDVAKQINNSISIVYPSVFGIGSAEITPTGGLPKQYALPENATEVIQVRVLDAFTKTWIGIDAWQLEVNSIGFSTSKTIKLKTSSYNRNIQVIYKSKPVAINFGQDFTTSGLPAECQYLIILGACDKLTRFNETKRFNNTEAVQNPQQTYGASLNNNKYFHQLYTEELVRQQGSLRSQYPPTITRTYGRPF